MITDGFTCSCRNWIMRLKFGWCYNSRLVIFFNVHIFFVWTKMKIFGLCMLVSIYSGTRCEFILSYRGKKPCLKWIRRQMVVYYYCNWRVVICIIRVHVNNIRYFSRWSHLPLVIDWNGWNWTVGWSIFLLECVKN